MVMLMMMIIILLLLLLWLFNCCCIRFFLVIKLFLVIGGFLFCKIYCDDLIVENLLLMELRYVLWICVEVEFLIYCLVDYYLINKMFGV